MSTEVMPRPTAAASRFEQKEMVEVIKQTVCKGASDAQLKMFLEVCKATGLDPFLKEIWFVAEKGIIMAGRDGYLRIANDNAMFDGIETTVERNPQGVPIKAICKVWRKDRSHPTVCEAYYSEYKKGSPVWTQYPSAMIGKVAEVMALKRSFSINGVVTEEEIGNPAEEKRTSWRDAKREQVAVMERKIAEMKAGKSYAEVSERHIVDDADLARPQTIDMGPEPPLLEADEGESVAVITVEQFKAAGKKGQIEAFGILKGLIGDTQYYRILGSSGCEHANEFRLLKQAVAAYQEMLDTLAFAQTLGQAGTT